jgi:hypothetical protein
MADAYNSILPMFLLNVDTEDVTPVGSCVLVQIGHEHFLRAAHVTDQAVNDYVIVIPVERRLAEIQGHFAPLGRLGERDDKACSLDISYFHLERQFADRIRPDYSPILGDAVHNLDTAAAGRRRGDQIASAQFSQPRNHFTRGTTKSHMRDNGVF